MKEEAGGMQVPAPTAAVALAALHPGAPDYAPDRAQDQAQNRAQDSTQDHGSAQWRLSFGALSAIWGSSFLFMHWGAAGFGAFATAGLRVGGAALVLVLLVMARGELGTLRARWKPIFIAGMLNSGIPFALYSYAVLSLDTGVTAILNATAPLFGAVIAWLWLGERLGRLRWLGLAVGFVGVGLLAAPRADFSAGGSGLAVLACLGACLCYGAAASFARRYLTGISPLVIAAGSQLGAAAGLALPTMLFWPAQPPGLRAWWSVGALVLLCTALAYVLYFRLIERAGPSRALAVTFIAPIFAVGYGSAFLGEPVTARMVACAVIIVGGTLLATGVVGPRIRRQR